MSKKIIGYLKLQVKGAAANPSPPVGPALGSKGLNIMEFCKRFNEVTKNQPGEILPVLITIYQDKSFDFIVKTPPASALILKAVDISKGSPEPNRKKVATITKENVQNIARKKMQDLNTFHLEGAIKMVEGTARSMGILVES